MKHLNDHITIAKELGYSDSVIWDLKKAKSVAEREKIMSQARRNLKEYRGAIKKEKKIVKYRKVNGKWIEEGEL